MLGIVTTAVYNPIAAVSKQRAERLETRMFGKTGTEQVDTAFWIQQDGIDGQTILRADRASDGGSVLSGITAFVYDRDGSFMERVEADQRASCTRASGQLDRSPCAGAGRAPARSGKTEIIATNITPRAGAAEVHRARLSSILERSRKFATPPRRPGLNAIGL